jgi:hypothetical protein
MCGQDLSIPFSIGVSQDNSSRTVTEKDAGRSVFIVNPVRDDLSTDHKAVVV